MTTPMHQKCHAILDRWFMYVIYRPACYILAFDMDKNRINIFLPDDVFTMVLREPDLFINNNVAKAIQEASSGMTITLHNSAGGEVFHVPMS